VFKAAIYCGLAGILLVIAIPNPSFRGSDDLSARVVATTAFGLVGIAMLANPISLVSGALAWANGAGRCSWIIFSGIVFLIPVVLLGGLL
jgi:uncharacterized membrane protein